MKLSFLFLFSLGLSLFCTAPLARADAHDHLQVYELRTYTLAPGKLDALLARFRDHTTKLFEKYGIRNVGYFVPIEAKDGAGEKLVYILAHASREAATASWKAFHEDPEWLALSKASEAGGKSVLKIESTFLAPTDFSPSFAATAASGTSPRVFELRIYTTPEKGLAALDERFREHTRALFKKHEMTDLVYWHPLDAEPGAGRTLIYLLAHPDLETAKAHWAAFRADPAWTEAKTASEKKAGGSLTTETKSLFLAPADFSALK